MEKIGYVYLTTNLVNGKQYVGQHLSEGFDTGYKGSGTYIMRAFKKYGWDNFKCEVICWCSSQTQLNEAEDNYIRLLNTMSPNGYNLRGGGANGKLCKETRRKLSEANKGQIPWNKGRTGVYSEETRKNMSEAQKKYFENEENRKKHSESLKGKTAWNKGKHHTEEARKKMSEAHKGVTPSEETRKNMSEAHKKRFKNPEERKKLSEARKKYYESEEGLKTRKKQSEANINNPKLSKKVYQYTLDGTFVKEYPSVSEAMRITNIVHITECCNGKLKSTGSYIWSYKPLN